MGLAMRCIVDVCYSCRHTLGGGHPSHSPRRIHTAFVEEAESACRGLWGEEACCRRYAAAPSLQWCPFRRRVARAAVRSACRRMPLTQSIVLRLSCVSRRCDRGRGRVPAACGSAAAGWAGRLDSGAAASHRRCGWQAAAASGSERARHSRARPVAGSRARGANIICRLCFCTRRPFVAATTTPLTAALSIGTSSGVGG